MIAIPAHIKGLIFDLDGTLADTMPWHIESWRKAGEDFGVEILPEMIHAYAGTPSLDLVRIFNKNHGWTLDPLSVKNSKSAHYHTLFEINKGVKPIEPVFSFAKAQQGKYPMCLATGSSREGALKSIESLGTMDWWSFIVTASDDIPGKPSPEIFLACAKAMNIEANACLVFEDGDAGIEAAKAAKMEYIDVRLL